MLCWSFKRLLYHEQGTGRMTADADRMRLIEAIDPARLEVLEIYVVEMDRERTGGDEIELIY